MRVCMCIKTVHNIISSKTDDLIRNAEFQKSKATQKTLIGSCLTHGFVYQHNHILQRPPGIYSEKACFAVYAGGKRRHTVAELTSMFRS